MTILRIIFAIALILLAYAIWFSVGIFGIVGGLLILEVPGAQLVGLLIIIAGFLLTLRFAGKMFRRLTDQSHKRAEGF